MKTTRIFFSILLVAVIGLVAWFFLGRKSETRAQQQLLILNLLDKEYYDDCRIAGSVHVPFDQLEQFVANLEKDSVEIIVYCSNYMCSTSGYAYKKLKNMGFKHVWMYEGGMAEWYQLGYPVEGMCTNSYLSVKLAQPHHEEKDLVGVITAQQLAQKMHVNTAA